MKGVVYCIKEKGNVIYIGSSTNYYRRMNEHKTHGKGPIHNYINSLPNKWYDVHFEVLQVYDDLLDREELTMYEREWYDVYQHPPYQIIPWLSEEEIAEEARLRAKEWREENPDKVEEQRKREPYNEKARERSKKWREENPDKVAEHRKNKDYLEKNRQRAKEWNEKMKGVIVNCECGAEVVRKGLPQHKKSKKHLEWLAKQ